ncbi:MAG: rod shape-determining protein MreD [Candidatus Rokubacteria bacterium]|nr:rod shape-determining protein MreD [Candidatus Rokubacteria bacterium]
MRLTLALMIFGGGIAQSSLAPVLQVGPVTPDIPLILTAFLGLRKGPEVGCLSGFATGLIQDVASGTFVGAQALTKALAGFGVGLLRGWFSVENPVVQVAGLVLLTLAEGILRFALLQLFHFPAEFAEMMLYVILPQALYNGFIGSAVTLALDWARARRSL